MHLVGLALEPFEKAIDAVPLRAPVARPVLAALPDPALLLSRELFVGRVGANAAHGGVGKHLLLAFVEGLCRPWLDGSLLESFRGIGDHERLIHRNDAAEAPAFLAGAYGRIEAEERSGGLGKGLVAVCAAKPLPVGGERRRAFFGLDEDSHRAGSLVKGLLDRLDRARPLDG